MHNCHCPQKIHLKKVDYLSLTIRRGAVIICTIDTMRKHLCPCLQKICSMFLNIFFHCAATSLFFSMLQFDLLYCLKGSGIILPPKPTQTLLRAKCGSSSNQQKAALLAALKFLRVDQSTSNLLYAHIQRLQTFVSSFLQLTMYNHKIYQTIHRANICRHFMSAILAS